MSMRLLFANFNKLFMKLAVGHVKTCHVQAIALIDELKKVLPLTRAQMHVRLLIPRSVGKKIKNDVKKLVSSIVNENFGIQYQLVCR